MTLGHEFTHRENDMNPWWLFGNNQKFVAYTNEVHADFGAAVKFGESNSAIQIQAMEYKLKAKEKAGKQDIANDNHPSWKRRIEYIQSKHFDKKLICQIATDVGCTNKKLIQKVVNHFDETHLN